MTESIQIIPARQSQLSCLPTRLALIDFRLIGTHEMVFPLKILKTLHELVVSSYYAPAIATFEQRADRLYASLADNTITPISLSDYGQIGVADGHHRLAAIKLLYQLGLLSSPTITVQLLPVRDHTIIKFEIVRIDGKPLSPHKQPLTLASIEACFLDPHLTIPSDFTTHFDVRFQDGSFLGVRNGQPDISIDRNAFFSIGYDVAHLAQRIVEAQTRLETSSSQDQTWHEIITDLSNDIRQSRTSVGS